MLATGEEIFRLIPQRPPMVMVDALYEADAEGGVTGLTVKEDNVFCIDSQLIEPGIIEHSAQSAAAFAGYRYFLAGEEPHIGLIGEIKSFRIGKKPAVGGDIEDARYRRRRGDGHVAGTDRNIFRRGKDCRRTDKDLYSGLEVYGQRNNTCKSAFFRGGSYQDGLARKLCKVYGGCKGSLRAALGTQLSADF